MSDGEGSTHAGRLAQEWREVRAAALELAAAIPETRAYRNTARAGWTLKHELAHLAALDAEVVHLLTATRQGLADRLDPVALRRLRGQAMHAAQEMRLGPLREHLAAAGEETARAIEAAADSLGGALEGALESSTTLVQERLARAREGAETLRTTLGR